MVIPVAGFHQQFTGQGVVGKVTVVADRHGVMRALLPPIEVLPHDVAIDANFRFVRQVGRTVGNYEGESPYTDQGADEQAGDHGQEVQEFGFLHRFPFPPGGEFGPTGSAVP